MNGAGGRGRISKFLEDWETRSYKNNTNHNNKNLLAELRAGFVVSCQRFVRSVVAVGVGGLHALTSCDHEKERKGEEIVVT